MNPDQLASSITLIILGLIFAVLPHATRPDLFFAVTVPPEFPRSPLGLSIVRRFQLAVLGVTVIAIALIFALGGRPGPAVKFLLPLGQLASVIVAFLLARQAVLPHAVPPERSREGDLRDSPQVIPGGILAAAGPLLLVLVSAVAALAWPERLPARLPVHFGLGGPDRWIEMSPSGLAEFFLLAGGVQVLFLLTTLGLSKSVGRAADRGARGAAEIRFRRMTVGMLLFTSYFLAIQSCLILFIADPALAGSLMNVFGMILAVVILIWIVILIRMGQGGSRSIGDGTPIRESGPQGDQRPDSTWKLGLFYYNPDDPAIFIEKRFGIGYTVNFGNRWTWVVLLVLVPLLAAAVHFLKS